MSHEPTSQEGLPTEPIDRLIGPLERFLHVEAASGIVLLACTAVALALANSPLAAQYQGLWETQITLGAGSFQMSYPLRVWINDALMAVFFFVVGLEVKREIVLGELRDFRRAALPLFAALGGMLGPALVYLALQKGEPAERGWGIPMATDIAFVVGCMAILSTRVPPGLRILLLSLAIADDIGAILVIAIGYTDNIHGTALALGVAGLALVFALGRFGVRSRAVYTFVGALVWLAIHESGVHATIAGVALGLMTPARSYLGRGAVLRVLARASATLQGEGWKHSAHAADRVRRLQWVARESLSPVVVLERAIHPWVGFVIMPIFALANTGVSFSFAELRDPVALAVGAGLVIGKPAGILIASWLAVRAGVARLPDGVTWTMLAGAGCLAGIGFTMALFISGLALDGAAGECAKVGILAGSALSALLGMAVLSRTGPVGPPEPPPAT
jgi:NhaA family Na+:H+ antiporter